MMSSLFQKFKQFSLFSEPFSRSLILGYATIVFLIVVSILVSLSFYDHLQNKIQKSEALYQKQLLITEHLKLARERSITLTRMLETDDIFLIDDLHQTMQQLESRIGKIRTQIKQTLNDPWRVKIFNKTYQLVFQNKLEQEEVYNLIIEEKRSDAVDVLINKTFKTQKEVIQTLTQLKEDIIKEYEKVKNQSLQKLHFMKKVILVVGLLPIAILMIIAFFTVRKIQFHERKRQRFQQELEAQIQQRTQELQMDRALFEHIHEAIALAHLNGCIIKSNRPFQNLLQQLNHNNANHATDSLWQLLSHLFKDIHIGNIQAEIEKNNKWRGEVQLKNDQKYYLITISHLYSTADNEALLSVVLNDVSQLILTQQKLEQFAKTDTVTQLKNRFAFNEDMQKQLLQHPNVPFCLMILDLDHFKAINDHFGHEEGDRLLRLMGEILQETVTQQQLPASIYRIGGDEFVVCVQQEMEDTGIAQFCNQVLKKANCLSKDWKKLGFGCSIGAARYPDDGSQSDEILRYADVAMYEAKKLGRNHFQIFNDAIHQKIDYIDQMQQQMQQAIHHKAFQVYFQPQVQLDTLSLCGAEALLRWPTDEGMISPAEFIPLAEKLDLINELGNFVLNETLNIFCNWQKHGNILPRVAINVSSIQIASQSLGPALKSALKAYPVHPGQLDFEITESVMMENKGNQNLCLSYLESVGCDISIDDFGTGYSSLAYIQNLNANRIKIDRSFVMRLERENASYNIVKAIIEMAHSLGLKVLAEGIETQEQLQLLQELGCDEGQGFFFSPPLPEEAFFRNYIQPFSEQKK